MEDTFLNKIWDNKKGFSRMFIIITILIILGIIGISIYNWYMTKTNTEKFVNYLVKDGYNFQTKRLYTKNTDNTTYYFLKNEKMISSLTIIENYDGTYKYSTIPIDNSYELTLNIKNGQGVSEQKITYNKKNKKYNCEIVSSTNIPAMCKEMKIQLDVYLKEVNRLLVGSGAKEKYIINKD